jgi:hypothetical protein
MCAKPQVWNSGAAMCVVQPRFIGIRDISATASSMPALFRGAPFGVPVVPEVRMMIRLGFSGADSSASADPSSISCSTVGVSREPASLSTQATTRLTSAASWSISVNSSSWTTTVGPSRSRTSTSCGPANAVLR